MIKSQVVLQCCKAKAANNENQIDLSVVVETAP